jgi:RNA polymerase sigma factor (sigma-70 family)
VLYSYALKICGDKELSMDCVQDLFVRLWEKREQLNAVSKVRSYLLQSIWHSVIKVMKKQRKNMLIDENSHYDIDMVFPHLDSLIESQEKDSKKKMLDSCIEQSVIETKRNHLYAVL